MRLLRRHAPLVAVGLAALIATALMPVFAHPFVYSLAGNLWAITVMLIVFDVTPRRSQEKQES